MEYGVLIIRRDGRLVEQPKLLRLGSMALGRTATNDITLAAPEISSLHARITCTATECKIRDIDSTNGTTLNGQKLEPRVDYPLRHGDTIAIGPFIITYQRPQRRVTAPINQDTPLPPLSRPAPGWMAPNGRKKKYDTAPIEGRSSYWQFLPPFYEEADRTGDESENGVLNGLLRIFETILTPLDRTINELPYYFDPRLAPAAMLPWLAFWVAMVLDENWPEHRRRMLISQAAELYRWRGTRKGMCDYIRIYTEIEPIIIEPERTRYRIEIPPMFNVPDMSHIDRALVALIERPLSAHSFRVILVTPDDRRIDDRRLRQIIEAEKPAHTGYELEMFRAIGKA
jgi:phage tail-like protein